MTNTSWRHGKVRDMYQINNNVLAMVQSNRQSAFEDIFVISKIKDTF